mmetsp:Transcript_115479/g.326413  ORF Transcript_115479/g.326413 Transcript_115479/m.326413 type:complete len:244 (+) Transcript_115479:347-1078(+)
MMPAWRRLSIWSCISDTSGITTTIGPRINAGSWYVKDVPPPVPILTKESFPSRQASMAMRCGSLSFSIPKEGSHAATSMSRIARGPSESSLSREGARLREHGICKTCSALRSVWTGWKPDAEHQASTQKYAWRLPPDTALPCRDNPCGLMQQHPILCSPHAPRQKVLQQPKHKLQVATNGRLQMQSLPRQLKFSWRPSFVVLPCELAAPWPRSRAPHDLQSRLASMSIAVAPLLAHHCRPQLL